MSDRPIIDDTGSAYPISDASGPIQAGVSFLVYAAIRLRVPDTGIDWLDDMIRESKRDEFAAEAMASLLQDQTANSRNVAAEAYRSADAMLFERGALSAQLATVTAERDEAMDALRSLGADWHNTSKRPCPTCDPISKLLGKPFGCTSVRLRCEVVMPTQPDASE